MAFAIVSAGAAGSGAGSSSFGDREKSTFKKTEDGCRAEYDMTPYGAATRCAMRISKQPIASNVQEKRRERREAGRALSFRRPDSQRCVIRSASAGSAPSRVLTQFHYLWPVSGGAYG